MLHVTSNTQTIAHCLHVQSKNKSEQTTNENYLHLFPHILSIQTIYISCTHTLSLFLPVSLLSFSRFKFHWRKQQTNIKYNKIMRLWCHTHILFTPGSHTLRWARIARHVQKLSNDSHDSFPSIESLHTGENRFLILFLINYVCLHRSTMTAK